MSGIARLSIEQEYASVGIKVTQAKLQITTPRLQMHVNQEMPEMTIESQKADFKVDWKQSSQESAFAYSQDHIVDLSTRLKEKNSAIVENLGANDANNAEDLRTVENKAVLAAQVKKRRPVEEVQRKEVHSSDISNNPPEVEMDPRHLTVKWSTRQFNVEWEGDYVPEVSLEPPYSVEIFLRNRPSIRITVEEITDPMLAGQKVDTTL